MSARRVALLGPFSVKALAPFVPGVAQPGVPPGEGGAALVNLALARISRGLPTDIITLDARLDEPVLQLGAGPVRLWIVRRRPRRAMRDGFRAERAGLLAALRASGADVCHAHWTLEYGLAAVSQDECPRVVTVHDHARRLLDWNGPRFLPHFLITRRVLARAGTLTAVSPYIADYAARVAGAPVPTIANCLYPASPSGTPAARRADADGPVILAAWSWAEFRNPKRGLAAFARFREAFPAARLLLMGVGLDPGGAAEAWARANGLAAGVAFLGLPPWDDVMRMLTTADVVFHPSLEDSFALPVAEAMLRGIPVVASRQAPGPAWLLRDGASGHLVDGFDPDALAAGLAACIRRDDGPARRAAAEHISRLCDPERILAAYDETYDRAGAARRFTAS